MMWKEGRKEGTGGHRETAKEKVSGGYVCTRDPSMYSTCMNIMNPHTTTDYISSPNKLL
jgi:hypothetical protein